MHEHFMKMAIEKAREGIQMGQSPFGACLVRNGKEVISIAHNEVWQKTDSTAHAEIQAIRYACQKLQTIDLSSCVLYSTCEPCPMCFSAIHWAKIDMIYFGARIEDAQKCGFNELTISNEQMKMLGKSSIKVQPEFLIDEAKKLFSEWLQSGNRQPY